MSIGFMAWKTGFFRLTERTEGLGASKRLGLTDGEHGETDVREIEETDEKERGTSCEARENERKGAPETKW